MPEDSAALATIPPAPPPSEQDYEAIFNAVVETARGRWFLSEYARRNRNADTALVLDAIARIEDALRGGAAPADERVRYDLMEMAKAIERTRAEIAAIKPDGGHYGKIGEASEELDSIVRATESATSKVLAAAEQIQEIAWTMREADIDPAHCDQLDARATDIYTACSFQDLTGQRIHKVIDVLHFLEQRINAMIAIWNDADGADNAQAWPARAGVPTSADLDQSDVDLVLELKANGKPATVSATDAAETQADEAVTLVQFEPSQDDDASPVVLIEQESEHEADVSGGNVASGEADIPAAAGVPQPAEAGLAAETVAVAVFTPPADETGGAPKSAVAPQASGHPLAAVKALSDEEKVALCS